MKKVKIKSLITLSFFLLFAALIVVLKTVDVGAIGPRYSTVGLSLFNSSIFDTLGTSTTWYDITEILGYISLAVAGGFVLYGGCQLIKRKSIKKVDADILLLGGFYALVVCFYILFEVCIINYRPVIINGEPEASFPSSHTMLSVCIMGSAILLFYRKIKNMILKILAVNISAIILLVTVAGRLLSGVHWATDIIGGVLLSFALIFLYDTAVSYINERQQN